MDATDKRWMLRSAQCDMVEIRKMLNADPMLAEKRDFFLGVSCLFIVVGVLEDINITQPSNWYV